MTARRFARVFWSPNAFEAHFVRTVLEAEGIQAQVRNENLAPYVPAEVWVLQRDATRALEIQEAAQPVEGGELALVEGEDEEASPSQDLDSAPSGADHSGSADRHD
jgi:hypothetical protein